MSRHPGVRIFLSLLIVLAACASATLARAGIGDALKKTGDKAAKKAEEEAKKASGQTAAPTAPGSEGAAGTAASEGGSPPATKVSAVNTKFDFVPGDNVILFDDMTQDDLGEFPKKFKLVEGTWEIAEREGKRWLRAMSSQARIRMKLPEGTTFPELWTLEFDFFGTEPVESGVTVSGMTDEHNGSVWRTTFPAGPNGVSFQTGSINSLTPLDPAYKVPGLHHMMYMGRGKTVKVYIDQQRVASVPEIAEERGKVNDLEILLWASSQPMITNVRFAEGPRPPKDMLAEGKLVTYGIFFASGSDVVLPESAPVIRQVATYMEANPTVKLKITGHTDNVGSAQSNADLSKRRSASVANVLATEFKIAPDRFETDGMGDTQPVAPNSSSEGKAKNRRVEFTKL